MTAQRSNAPLNGTRRKAVGASPRGLNVAVTAAALPAVILSSAALAHPAAAAPAPQAPAARHSAGPVTAVPSRAVVPAALVAVQVPTQKITVQVPTQKITVAAQTVPSEYTIKPGDTIWAIANERGLTTDAVLTLNHMDARTIIHPGQKIKLTGSADPAVQPAPAAPTPAAPQSGSSYIVKPGDTLGAIAARHGVGLESLFTANNLSMTSIIYPGQKIDLGGSAPAPDKPAPAPAPADGGTYIVKPGDTLGAIAARHGVGLESLLTANNLSMTSIIYPGQKLTLTGSVTTQATPPNAQQPGPAPAPAPAPTGLVPSTFLGHTYPDKVVADANADKALLNSLPAPSPAEMRQIVADTARSMGVDPSLALAFAHQESGFNQRAVSPANAIGTMQVIPSSGQWAGDLVGRELNLLDPYDNATAGVAIIRSLVRTSPSLDIAIASYYQGQYSVQTRGMFEDTKQYVAAIKAHQNNFR